MSTEARDGRLDDPTLTAYALGELEPEERAAVEARLAQDPAAREYVEEVRALGRVLETELEQEASSESAPLTEAQRAAIAASVGAAAPATRGALAFEEAARRRRGLRRVTMGAAAAASLLVVVGFAALQAGWLGGEAASGAAERGFAYRLFGTNPPPAASTARRADGGLVARAPSRQNDALKALEGLGYVGSDRPRAQRPAAEMERGARLLEQLGYASGAEGATSPPSEAEPALRALGYDGYAYDDAEEEVFEESVLRDQERIAREVEHDTEAYDRIVENGFERAKSAPLSTFSIDVDTASYSNVRRFLVGGELPPPDAVRIEELVNYFPYDYAPPVGSQPFSVSVETASAPWAPRHRLLRVGLMGRAIGLEGRKPSNLVFLVDVSGSMDEPDKLPLLQRSLQLLVQELDERDTISLVVYASATGLVLPPTRCDAPTVVLDALQRLEAGGSTDGGSGIQLAYKVAQEAFVEGGNNRVILATDGDFNVGITDQGSLLRLIEEKAKGGVFLTVLGFGGGNYKDSTLEKLADKGNGNYAYIDSLLEARKVLVEQMGGTLETIAKDVKIQVEFNPLQVEAWRLIGYENRLLAAQDFNDDTKDAGEIGAGHTVTALYELVPKGVPVDASDVDPLRFQTEPQPTGAAFSDEVALLKLRYKEPDGDASRLIEVPVRDDGGDFAVASDDFRFATSVAAFGMVLRGSEHCGETTLEQVLQWASGATSKKDRAGYRVQFLELVRAAVGLQRSGRDPRGPR